MSKIITACELKFDKKNSIYRITTSHKDGAWEGSQSGAKIFCIGNYLVETLWGSGIPVAVYKDEEEMMKTLENRYRVKPTIIK